MRFREEETLHQGDRVFLESVRMDKTEQQVERTIQPWVVNTVGVIVKFSNARMSLVDGRVLNKSTTRLAHLPTLYANPGSGHGVWGGNSSNVAKEKNERTECGVQDEREQHVWATI